MNFELPTFNSVALILITVGAGMFATWFWRSRATLAAAVEAAAAATAERDKRINDLERQLILVNAAVLPISEAFKVILIKQLTHYHTPRLDYLMTLIGPPCKLTVALEAEMGRLLEERTRDMHAEIDELERDAATMLPLVIKRTRMEAQQSPVLQVVSVPPDPPK